MVRHDDPGVGPTEAADRTPGDIYIIIIIFGMGPGGVLTRKSEIYGDGGKGGKEGGIVINEKYHVRSVKRGQMFFGRPGNKTRKKNQGTWRVTTAAARGYYQIRFFFFFRKRRLFLGLTSSLIVYVFLILFFFLLLFLIGLSRGSSICFAVLFPPRTPSRIKIIKQ